MLGQLKPDEGDVRVGANVQIAYYDQQREQLDPEKTVFDTVGEGNDTVTANGRTRHVHAYLRDFLFSNERARSPVKALSGGERNRLLLARLFTRPANVLVLDEPTNDLDLETLELLEEQLVEWPGTLLLVSHDRAFLDNVVTSTLVFEGNGRVQEFVGGYVDWVRQSTAEARSSKTEARDRRPDARGKPDVARPKTGAATSPGPEADAPRSGKKLSLQRTARTRRPAGADRRARSGAERAERESGRAGLLQGIARRHRHGARPRRGTAARTHRGLRAVDGTRRAKLTQRPLGGPGDSTEQTFATICRMRVLNRTAVSVTGGHRTWNGPASRTRTSTRAR